MSERRVGSTGAERGGEMVGPVAIEGVPQHYDWGSTTAIPTLLGLPPAGRPLAELWFGDHPNAPSPVPRRQRTLDQVVAGDPHGVLGNEVVRRFGNRLPFLVKILAAEKALSVQVHPNAQQARDGFASEEAAGIPCKAPHRNYRDANHKPELLCAVTDFDAMCGFRSPEAIHDVLAELQLHELDFLAAAIRRPDPLRQAFSAVLEHPDPAEAVAAVTERVSRIAEGPLVSTRLASEDHPGDVGVLLSLLLNYIRLAPGEAIYLGAGKVHAYLRGMAVEVMANSDNVLRCGLTNKHIDVHELMKITDFTEQPDPRRPDRDGTFGGLVEDFQLTRHYLDTPLVLNHPGPQIVLCMSGRVHADEVEIRAGRAMLKPAGWQCTLRGDGLVFIVGPGSPPGSARLL